MVGSFHPTRPTRLNLASGEHGERQDAGGTVAELACAPSEPGIDVSVSSVISVVKNWRFNARTVPER